MLYYPLDNPKRELTREEARKMALPATLPRYLGSIKPEDLEQYGFTRAPQPGAGQTQDIENGRWIVRDKTAAEFQADVDAEWGRIRKKRDTVLGETDWLMKRHNEQVKYNITPTLSATEMQDLANYRQALRDITEYATPDDVVWPDNPLGA